MKDDPSLRKVLKDLSISLSEDNEKRDITFRNDEELGAITEDRTITINPEHAEILDADINERQEFALIVNTESHEIEHDHVTNVEKMREFSEEYEDSRPRMAGFIWNVIEDVYIDKRRTERDKGLRPTQAFMSQLIRENSEKITEVESPRKYATAVLQIGKAGGVPVGFTEVEADEFKQYCAQVKNLIEEARESYIQSRRTQISHEIMDLIEDHAGELDAPELEMPDFMVDPSGGGNGDPLPEPNENDNMEQGGGMQGQPTGGRGPSSQGSNTTCPDCGSSETGTNNVEVDPMVAARCNPPFNTGESWVESVEFIAENENDGICGFRVTATDNPPAKQIEMQGYKIADIGSNQIEIVEPKERYSDPETVEENYCEDCGNEWLPTIDLD